MNKKDDPLGEDAMYDWVDVVFVVTGSVVLVVFYLILFCHFMPEDSLSQVRARFRVMVRVRKDLASKDLAMSSLSGATNVASTFPTFLVKD